MTKTVKNWRCRIQYAGDRACWQKSKHLTHKLKKENWETKSGQSRGEDLTIKNWSKLRTINTNLDPVNICQPKPDVTDMTLHDKEHQIRTKSKSQNQLKCKKTTTLLYVTPVRMYYKLCLFLFFCILYLFQLFNYLIKAITQKCQIFI